MLFFFNELSLDKKINIFPEYKMQSEPIATVADTTNCPHRTVFQALPGGDGLYVDKGIIFCSKYWEYVTMQNCENRCGTNVTEVGPFTFKDEVCEMTNEDWERLSYAKIEPANRTERRKMMRCKTYMTADGGEHRLSRDELKKVIEYKRKTRNTFRVKGESNGKKNR